MLGVAGAFLPIVCLAMYAFAGRARQQRPPLDAATADVVGSDDAPALPRLAPGLP